MEAAEWRESVSLTSFGRSDGFDFAHWLAFFFDLAHYFSGHKNEAER